MFSLREDRNFILDIFSIFLDDESDRKGKRSRSRSRGNSRSRQNSRPSSRLSQNDSKREELPSQDEISKIERKKSKHFPITSSCH